LVCDSQITNVSVSEDMLKMVSEHKAVELREQCKNYGRNYTVKSRDSLVGIALGYGLDDRVLGFDHRLELGIFLFATVSRTALGTTQPPIQLVPRTLPLEVKLPGREADHSPPSSAEFKNVWRYTSTPPIRLHGVVLI
jgi:hypothetical protein